MTADPITSQSISSSASPPSRDAGATSWPDTPVPADPVALADSLFYSVSHDLRSPLLTMSLSADLITDALERLPESASGSVAIALDAMRHGAKDMERMLQALTLLSRARRRSIRPSRVNLQVILGGQVVISDVSDLEHVEVAVDPVPVLDILDALATTRPLDVHARLEDGGVVLDCEGVTDAVDAEDAEDAESDTSPLELLVGSLHHHAGTVLETLAESQVLLERQGGTVRCRGGRLLVWLPLAAPARGGD